MIKVVMHWFLGNMTGCFASYENGAFTSLPPSRSRFVLSCLNGLRLAIWLALAGLDLSMHPARAGVWLLLLPVFMNSDRF